MSTTCTCISSLISIYAHGLKTHIHFDNKDDSDLILILTTFYKDKPVLGIHLSQCGSTSFNKLFLGCLKCNLSHLPVSADGPDVVEFEFPP